MKTSSLGMVLILVWAISPFAAAQTNFIADLGWESGALDNQLPASHAPVLSFQSFANESEQAHGPISKTNSPVRYVEVVKVPWARSGEYVAKVYARPPAFRSEFALMAKPYRFGQGTSQYFSASFRPDGSWDAPSKYSIIITQWKLFGSSPMAMLRLSNDGKRELTFHVTGGRKKQVWKLGAMPKDEWTEIRVFFHWSTDDTGVIRVWKNGKLLLEHKGCNMTKNAGGYVKLGMYTEINDPRTLHIDEVRVWEGDTDSMKIGKPAEVD